MRSKHALGERYHDDDGGCESLNSNEVHSASSRCFPDLNQSRSFRSWTAQPGGGGIQWRDVFVDVCYNGPGLVSSWRTIISLF